MILDPLGFQQITGLSAVKSLIVPAGAQRALLVVTAQNVRFRDDGTNPTGTIGMRLVVDTLFWYTGDLAKIKFIEESASAVLNVSYYA